MSVTLFDLFRDVQDSLYSYSQVKDTKVYLSSDLSATGTAMVLAQPGLKALRVGQTLQLLDPYSLTAELVRVRALDSTSSTATLVRAVMGTNATAWTAAASEVSVEPEFPVQAITREINNAITGLPPAIHAIRTKKFVIDPVNTAYDLPADAVGVVSVDWLPIGPDNAWQSVRRYRFDPVNRQVRLMNMLEPGQSLKVTWRGYPEEMSSGSDCLEDIGLGDELRQVVVWGALYRLVAGRLPGRLIDTRSETPLNGQYRTADPVTQAVRQVYALYTQALERERERHRHAWPVRSYMTF